MAAKRSAPCPHCGGTVAVPKRRRNIDLAYVQANHQPTCPGTIRMKEKKQ